MPPTPCPLPPVLLTELRPLGRYGVQENAALAPHTSFQIGGPAAALLTIHRQEHLLAALDLLHRHQVPFLLLGGGSNVLISDAGVPGLVILNQCRRSDWPPPDSAPPLAVRVQTGAPLAGFARSAIKRGYAGLAWAVSVPGAVGGAIIGNAGAHGGCIADSLHSVEVWQAGQRQTLPAAALDFSYRRSRFKALTSAPGLGPVLLAATFHLQRDADDSEPARAAAYIAHRRRTQPVDKSAGSIFKNPPGDFAGRLIEAAGLKDARSGGASVSLLHANFIINANRASAADVVHLINHIRRVIYQRHALLLEPEIQFLGDWSAGPALWFPPSPS